MQQRSYPHTEPARWLPLRAHIGRMTVALATASLQSLALGCTDEADGYEQSGQARSLAELDASCAPSGSRGSIDAGAIDGGVVTASDAGSDAEAEREADDGIGHRVRFLNVQSSGCKLKPVMIDNGRDVELALEDLSLEGTKVVDFASCMIAFVLESPPDREIAISSFEGSGTASLPAGTHGDFSLNASPPGRASLVEARTFEGPVEGAVSFRREFTPEALSFSVCPFRTQMIVRVGLSLMSDGKTPASIRVEKLGNFRFTTRPCRQTR